MHLQQHFGFQPVFFELVRYPVHRQFDNIGRAALNRGINRCAFGIGGQSFILVINSHNRAASSKRCQNIIIGTGKGYRIIHIFLNFGHFAEISINISFGIFRCHADLSGQAICGNAVNNSEIDGFGVTAGIGIHFIIRNSKDVRCRCRVNIYTGGKSVFQGLNIGNSR